MSFWGELTSDYHNITNRLNKDNSLVILRKKYRQSPRKLLSSKACSNKVNEVNIVAMFMSGELMDKKDIHFHCKYCGAKYKTHPKRANKMVKCKYCSSKIIVQPLLTASEPKL